ncbi:MAG: two-component regulator propeller domain-containing protein [Cyclobacteriaceae bacterium]|nr:two-component regulator propeller domain-containing protein [Cyclobacteriaceae bacterium]
MIGWVQQGGGLIKYDRTSKKITNFRYEPYVNSGISGNYISCLLFDKQGMLWIGTENGLTSLNLESGRFTRYQVRLKDGTPNIPVNALFIDSQQHLWVGTLHGLFKMNPESSNANNLTQNPFVHLKHIASSGSSIIDKAVLSIQEDRQGNIWFGTNDGGLGQLNAEKNTIHTYIVDPNDDRSLLSNQVNAVYEDASGIIWIGTNAGISVLDKMKDRFSWHKRSQGINNTLSSNNILAILRETNGKLWLGTHDQGLTMYNPSTEIYTTYLTDDQIIEGQSVRERNKLFMKFDQRQSSVKPIPINYLSHNRINALLKDKSGNIWIGTGGGGINILNTGTGKITRVTHDAQDSTTLVSNNIRCLYLDSKDRLWIGTEDGGLAKYYRKSIQSWKHSATDLFSISGNDIRSIVEDDNGDIWIGTFSNGLNRFDEAKNRFIRYFHIENNTNSLSSNTIYSLYNEVGKIWIGTASGLNILDVEKNNFTRIGMESGLLTNSVYSIEDDKNGNLWISTNQGISSISKSTLAIRNYGMDDGILGSEFNPGSSFRSNKGEIFFGGIDGYCSFFPDKLNEKRQIPNVLITDFKILNEKVPVAIAGSPLKTHISKTDTLILSYKDLSISFEFVALNFTNARKIQYAYMMENFDNKWNYVGNRRYANYTNLPPGNYTFRVKASTSDSNWDEQGKSVLIIIKPPYWKTWWFYAFLFTFALGTILILIQLRTRSLHRSKALLEEKVKIRTKQIKEKNKSLEQANSEILIQKTEIENQNKLLWEKNEEISIAKTELDNSNKELQDINSNLESIVADRTSSLSRTNQELKNANNELDLFIYRASHDLKGPIARLLGMTLLAKMDNKDEALREYIDLIERGAIDMNKILNKLNNIHFINRQSSATEEIDFQKIIKDCTPGLANYIDLKDLEIRLIVEKDFKLRSDYVLMKIIIENLLENGVIFRKTKQAQIEISLQANRRAILISVKDNGLGILKDQHEKIFDMFYRGSERSKGNGLGLYLVRKATQKLNGQVTVESEEGKYTCFTVSLPQVIVSNELRSLVS